MFEAVFDAMTAFNQVGFIFGGFVFLGIAALLTADHFSGRRNSIRQMATISGVRAVKTKDGKHRIGYEAEGRGGSRPSGEDEDDEQKTGIAGFLFAGIFVIVSLVFIVLGFYLITDYLSLRKSGLQTKGEIVRYESSYSSDSGTSYHPVVSYKDNTGRTYQQESNFGSSSKPYKIGESVPVIYDPADPERFAMGSFWRNMLFPLAAMAMGGIFLAVICGLFMVRGKKKDPQKGVPMYGTEMYYAVLRYQGLDGEVHESETGFGSSTIANKLPGTEVPVLVDPQNPEQIKTAGNLKLVFALIFSIPGIALLWMAFTSYDFTIFTILFVIAAIAFGFYKFANSEKAQKLWNSRHQLKDLAASLKPSVSGYREGVMLSDQEIRDRLRNHDRATLLCSPLLGIIGAGLIWGGWYLGGELAWLGKNGLRVPGAVTRVESVYNSSSEGSSYTYYPFIQFTTEYGESVEFRSNTGSNPPMYRSGDTVTVLYDPENPRAKARIDSGWLNWVLPGGLFSAGVLVLFAMLKTVAGVLRRRRIVA
jgi:hypothetical protein